jgi:diguanylate cyclase (GGDEF)-like protein/PAS domain S-box-containing protein
LFESRPILNVVRTLSAPLLQWFAGFAAGAAFAALMLWRQARRIDHAVTESTARLRQSEARIQALVRNSHDVIAVLDRDGALKFASPAAERAFGRPVEQLLHAPPFDFAHPDDRARVHELFFGTLARPGAVSPVFEFHVLDGDGNPRVLEAVGTNLVDDPAIEGVVLNARDVTERRWAEAELLEAQEGFRSAFEHAPIGMALASTDGQLFRVNRALAHMLGRAEDELLSVSLLTLTHPDDRSDTEHKLGQLVAGEIATYQLEQRFLHTDGREVWVAVSASLVCDSSGFPMYVVHQIEDITARRRDGERLAHQAIHDPLTGLPNRLLFVDRLRRALSSMDTEGRTAVLFLDLDHFKVINDSLGHSAGDRLLVTIADRLRTAVRPNDTVARFGGDEFTVLCHGVPDEDAATEIADRVAAAVAKPVMLSEGEVYVTASVGIALSGGDMETPETLLRNADAAMYSAKDHGRARVERYDAVSRDHAVSILRTGNELHRALERGEMSVFYQPIMSLETQRIAGFEALLRWQHPERGLVGPDQFVGLAEETGLVVPIGGWVLEQACRQAAAWHQQGAPITISVNLSPRQLAEPTLPETVARVLHRTGVDPDRVWLEITESTLMRDAESAVSVLHALTALGVHLSVDDFGTGYSSMTYLKRFPVEALKVDRSFVDGLGRETEATAICTAIVSLAHALGMRAVAEGVETHEQLASLRTLGCELAQGYLFGRPAPADRFAVRARRRKRVAHAATIVAADAPEPVSNAVS